MFVMVSVTVVMRVGDNNQEDGRTTLECEQTQSKLQETEGINGLKIKKKLKKERFKKKKIYKGRDSTGANFHYISFYFAFETSSVSYRRVQCSSFLAISLYFVSRPNRVSPPTLA